MITAHQLRHLRTRPYTPCTNGKAERFIRTLLAEWAYAQAYRTSLARTLALTRYLGYYNSAPSYGHSRGSPLGRSLPRCEQFLDQQHLEMSQPRKASSASSSGKCAMSLSRLAARLAAMSPGRSSTWNRTSNASTSMDSAMTLA